MEKGDIVDALAQLSWHVQERIGDAAAANGVSLSQLRLLGILRDRELEMQALATYLHLDKSSVTGLVARAEARGLLERVQSEIDGRRVVVRMTDAGHALTGRVVADVHRLLTPTIDAIPERERADFVRLAETIAPGIG